MKKAATCLLALLPCLQFHKEAKEVGQQDPVQSFLPEDVLEELRGMNKAELSRVSENAIADYVNGRFEPFRGFGEEGTRYSLELICPGLSEDSIEEMKQPLIGLLGGHGWTLAEAPLVAAVRVRIQVHAAHDPDDSGKWFGFLSLEVLKVGAFFPVESIPDLVANQIGVDRLHIAEATIWSDSIILGQTTSPEALSLKGLLHIESPMMKFVNQFEAQRSLTPNAVSLAIATEAERILQESE